MALPGGPAPASAAEPDAASAPLEVTIASLSPSVIPRRGRVTITGRITNRSTMAWTNLQVFMFTSATPMRTSEELTAASHTDPAAEVGSRIYKSGLYDQVGDLAPGQSTSYVLSVPRRDLHITGQPGVYWVGVHVLGGNVNGRDGIADGRARTFMPLMSSRGPGTSLALVVPLQAHVGRLADGTLAHVNSWRRRLRPDGRLGRLLSLSATSTQPLTWVVDPAVLDAAASVAGGNPPLDVNQSTSSATPSPTPGQSPGQSPAQSPGPSLGSSPDRPPGTSASPPSSAGAPSGAPATPGVPGQAGGSRPTSPDARAAAAWLRAFQTQAAGQSVLAVPYGDLDVASVMRHQDQALYRSATALSASTLLRLGVTSSPAVDPPRGLLPPSALGSLGGDTTVLLSDRAVPDATGPVVEGAAGSASGQEGAPSIALIDSTASSGGPGPNPRFTALAVRQRILSEAAVHALSPDRGQPLVVSTPDLWNPGSDWRTSDFFAGLDVPWLQRVGVPAVLGGAGTSGTSPGTTSPPPSTLVYPQWARKAELPSANLQASQELAHTGKVLAGLLAQNRTVDTFLAKAAMLDSSVRARNHPRAVRGRAITTARRMRSLMQRVRIDGPSFVTMSSEAGTFSVTLVNGLQQPVTVGVEADTGSPDLSISSPDPITLGPGQRASVRLHATARDIGVHSVTLLPTNADGVPVSSGTRFSVRSSQVGLVIWIIMGIGAGVLLLASAVRIVRRVRRPSRTEPTARVAP